MAHIEHPARAVARPYPATPTDMDATLFTALELSLSSWVVMASAPGKAKAIKNGVSACDGSGLLALLKRPRKRAGQRCRRPSCKPAVGYDADQRDYHKIRYRNIIRRGAEWCVA